MITIEKTVFFAVDGKQVPVAELPMPVRKHFELLDAFRQEQADASVKLAMANTAVQVKTLELQEIVKKIIAPVEPASNGEALSSNE